MGRPSTSPTASADHITASSTSGGLELRRTVELFSRFRREGTDPDSFYTFLAADALDRMERIEPLAGLTLLDVGGGPGYVADEARRRGARCIVAEYSSAELHLHGRTPTAAMVADGQQLPVAGRSIDAIHCSNVLEHVPQPSAFLDELVRVLRPGGLLYLSFTNWLSPWGGHETSPWHYFGGRYAADRWQRKTGQPPKNDFGSSLYRLGVGEVLKELRSHPDLQIRSAQPRYLPSWTRPIIHLPGIREVATWNLEIIGVKQFGAVTNG